MECMAEQFSSADAAELAFRVELVTALVKVLQSDVLDFEALANHAGVAHKDIERVRAGSAEGIPTDTLIRILGAAGYLGRLNVVKCD